MKHISLLLGTCLSVMFLLSCQQTNSPKTESGIVGQIYEVGSPAEPVGWTPPPLKGARTIVVSDSNKADSRMLLTDSLVHLKLICSQVSIFFWSRIPFGHNKERAFRCRCESDYLSGKSITITVCGKNVHAQPNQSLKLTEPAVDDFAARQKNFLRKGDICRAYSLH